MSSSGKVIIGNANFHDVKFEQELAEKKKMDSYWARLSSRSCKIPWPTMSILCDEYQTSMKAVKINKESQLSILNSVTWFLMLPFSNAESQIIEVSRSQTILETQKLTLHQSCPFLDSKTQRDKWGGRLTNTNNNHHLCRRRNGHKLKYRISEWEGPRILLIFILIFSSKDLPSQHSNALL